MDGPRGTILANYHLHEEAGKAHKEHHEEVGNQEGSCVGGSGGGGDS